MGAYCARKKRDSYHLLIPDEEYESFVIQRLLSIKTDIELTMYKKYKSNRYSTPYYLMLGLCHDGRVYLDWNHIQSSSYKVIDLLKAEELLAEHSSADPPIIIGDHVVKIGKDTIQVGYQRVWYETIREILKRMEEMRENK